MFWLSTQSSDELASKLGECSDQETVVQLGYSVGLNPIALGHLKRLANLRKLELHEIYLSEQDLAEILKLPALREISFQGGTSSEWTGEIYVFPSVGKPHLKQLAKAGQRLERIEFAFQELEDSHIDRLKAALPGTQIISD